MFLKTLPLILLCACASTAQLPTAEQPDLARVAQPYVPELQALGISRVISPGNGAMVRLDTAYGSVYVPYPLPAEPLAFVLNIGPEGSARARRRPTVRKKNAYSRRSCPKPSAQRPGTMTSNGCAPILGNDHCGPVSQLINRS